MLLSACVCSGTVGNFGMDRHLLVRSPIHIMRAGEGHHGASSEQGGCCHVIATIGVFYMRF